MGGPEIPAPQEPTCSPFPPTASYQQGVLSATLLYEILLGKATLYAVLVSALVLMAMVRSRVGRDRQVGGDPRNTATESRSIGTLPGPEVGNRGRGRFTHLSRQTPCHSGPAVEEPWGRSQGANRVS